MTELLQVAEPEIEFFGTEEKDQASALKEEVEFLLSQISGHEKTLSGSYVRLGRLMNRVQNGKHWIPWGFVSFGSYVDSVTDRLGRERSSIYEFCAVSEKLLPQISEGDLETMGISRASLLKKFVVNTSRQVTPELLSAALDPTVKVAQLKAQVYAEMHQQEDPKGKWRDIGFYCLDEEFEEIKQARALVPVEGNLPEWAIWREAILAFSREFYSTNIAR